MGKLSEEVKALRAKERAEKKARLKKRIRETASARNAQRVRKNQKRKK